MGFFPSEILKYIKPNFSCCFWTTFQKWFWRVYKKLERGNLIFYLFFSRKKCIKNKKMTFFFIFCFTTNFYFRPFLFSTFSLKKKDKWVARKGENMINTMWKTVSFAFLQNVFKERFQRKCNGIIFFWRAVSTEVEVLNFFFRKLEEWIKITLPNSVCESCMFHPRNFSLLLATRYVRLCVYGIFLNWYVLVEFGVFVCCCAILEVTIFMWYFLLSFFCL